MSIFPAPVKKLTTARFSVAMLGLGLLFAATIAFVTAPLIAWLNYQAITDATVPVEHQPGVGFRIYSLLCLSTMAVFALGYLYLRFFSE